MINIRYQKQVTFKPVEQFGHIVGAAPGGRNRLPNYGLTLSSLLHSFVNLKHTTLGINILRSRVLHKPTSQF